MSELTLRFSGNGDIPIDEFVKKVAVRASAEGKQLDNKWNVEFVVTRLSGPALKWYESLDKDVRGDWSKLRKALEDKYRDNKPSSPKRSIWRRATGSSSRGPSRSNSLAESFMSDGALPSYGSATAGAKAPISFFSSEPEQLVIAEGSSLGYMDPAIRRVRLVSKASGKEVGYVSRFQTASNWFVYTTDVSEAAHVKLGTDSVMELLNGPPSVQPPVVLTVGWSADVRGAAKEPERYASLSCYEKSFAGFLQAREGWVARWQSGPSSRVKPFHKKALGFGDTPFTGSISERTKALRLHEDFKAYKRKDSDAIEVEFMLEPLK